MDERDTDERLWNAAQAQAAAEAVRLHERAAEIHQEAAKLQAEHTAEMTEKGEPEKAARASEVAVEEGNLAALERARADQARARHQDMASRLDLPEQP